MKEKYVGRIVIKAGIEFGVQLHTIDLFQRDYEQCIGIPDIMQS